ncbi:MULTISPECIES: glucosaminidase domain-containing protein [unclassified Nitratiruptor]|uniref:glucosaminidase domain-containing protein n=1 Tax=unclassified Nitratiruptor TaxID=2624044 RepID=UPI00191639F5|nr:MULTISPECIES: glucosaminidase domain-containing protein [unclassified Nitratiruptor]BCD59377.1 Bax protein [Nitratiruptor sp. YY08-10]BCD63301.1 Bax protein [Nitratiruptor sp. YY08-14]
MVRRVFVVLAFLATFAIAGLPQWYYSIKNTKIQKEEFFRILKPLVEKENQKVLMERAFIIAYFRYKKSHKEISVPLQEKFEAIVKKYRIKNRENMEEFLQKIDAIPVSLVLAQAALESGWGKSRFAKEANNLFGEWTYGKRGLVPKNRKPGQKHKIRIFNSIQDSIASYMLNLNRHAAYKEFRMARYLARKAGKQFSGLQAAMTMEHYSGIGERYNYLVRSIIKKHALHRMEERATHITAL